MTSTETVVLAVDFGGTKVALATVGRHGTVLESDRFTFAAQAGADQIVDHAIERARSLIRHTEVRCVGVSSPGIVLPDRVLLAPNVPGWEDLALADRFRAGLGIEPVVGNDVKAAASAELRWGSLAGRQQAIYLNLGTGISTALVVNGAVVFGAHGAAGEIAYNLTTAETSWKGVHAGRAPLEEVVSGKAIGLRGARLTGAEPSARRVFELARTDPAARELIDQAIRQLAMHVANLAIALDPAVIAVGGGMMAAAESILPTLRAAIQAAVPFPPELVQAHFRYDAALHGAAAMALDRLRFL